MIKLMVSKLHHFNVTSADVDYVGSIAIDSALMEEAGIIPLQEVEIVNLANGNRWSTYALPAPPGTGIISPNGGGALLCKTGDTLIIFSYKYMQADDLQQHVHRATILIGNNDNQIVEKIVQSVSYDNKSKNFTFDQSNN